MEQKAQPTSFVADDLAPALILHPAVEASSQREGAKMQMGKDNLAFIRWMTGITSAEVRKSEFLRVYALKNPVAYRRVKVNSRTWPQLIGTIPDIASGWRDRDFPRNRRQHLDRQFDADVWFDDAVDAFGDGEAFK